MERPIFFDASGKRNRWTVRAFFAGLVLLLVTAATFAATVVNVPIPGPLVLAMERPHPRPLAHQLGKAIGSVSRWLPGGKAASGAPAQPIKLGFYVPWDDASRASLLPISASLTGLPPA